MAVSTRLFNSIAKDFGALFKEGPRSAGRAAQAIAHPFTWTVDKVAAASMLPVKAFSWSAKKAPGLTTVGVLGTGGLMAYTTFKPRTDGKELPPEMQEMQAQVAANQPMLDAVGQAQLQQAALAQSMAVPAAANDNPSPTTTLEAGNLAQLQGRVSAQGPQVALA